MIVRSNEAKRHNIHLNNHRNSPIDMIDDIDDIYLSSFISLNIGVPYSYVDDTFPNDSVYSIDITFDGHSLSDTGKKIYYSIPLFAFNRQPACEVKGAYLEKTSILKFENDVIMLQIRANDVLNMTYEFNSRNMTYANKYVLGTYWKTFLGRYIEVVMD